MKLFAVCGREGAGKTTLTNYITGNYGIPLIEYDNSWAYILATLFNCDYYQLAKIIPQAHDRERLLQLDSQIATQIQQVLTVLDTVFPNNIERYMCGKFIAPELEPQLGNGKWCEIMFAQPLKQIIPAITGIDYNIINPTTLQQRELREKQVYHVAGVDITGRQALMAIGTAFREYYNKNFWVDIARNRISRLQHKYNIIVSDLRFKNEAAMLLDCGCKIIVVSRGNDLQITDNDQTSHPSKWEFLTFIDHNSIILDNTAGLQDFYDSIEQIFAISNEQTACLLSCNDS